jgi:hypothetical protein
METASVHGQSLQEVEALTEKGAVIEADGEDGYISRYFLESDKLSI